MKRLHVHVSVEPNKAEPAKDACCIPLAKIKADAPCCVPATSVKQDSTGC